VVLIDRTAEMKTLAGLLDGAEIGSSAAILLRGEAGIGKTALLQTVGGVAAERGMRTASVAGIEAEAPLGYAALHRLLQLFPEAIDRLPAPQRDALRFTLGLVSGPPPDRFLVGLGLLTLLADGASEHPLLIVVDDAHWVDLESGTVLGFAARRLQAERMTMLFAARDAEDEPAWLSDVPELRIGRLEDSDARGLLAEVTGGLVSPDIQARLVEGCSGNPLALVEVAHHLTPEQLSGGAVLPVPLPVGGPVQQLFVRRLDRLSPGARRLVAVAAAEPTASLGLVWRVARRLGVDTDGAAAELDRLVTFNEGVEFLHPLVRSAAYYDLPASERRLVHRALGQEMDSPHRSDRAAWHLALAATGPDEAIARRLDRAAQRANDGGGYAAATTLLRRAADLSADEDQRTDRLLAASEAALAAALPEQAQRLLDLVGGHPMNERQTLLALRLSSEASFSVGATDEAARGLLAAAKMLMAIDPPLARRTLLRALSAAVWAARDVLTEVRSYGMTLREPGASPDELREVTDLFLFGFLRRLAGDVQLAAPLLREALSELERSKPSDGLRAAIPPVVPAIASAELIDDGATFTAASSFVEFARRAGALTLLPNALVGLARVHIRQGRFVDAEDALAEASQLVRATGAPGSPDILADHWIFLLCWRGDEAEAQARAAALMAARRPGPGHDLISGHLAVLDLSAGRYKDAFDRLAPITGEDRLGFGTIMLPDFVEAAARSGQRTAAVAALDRLAPRAVAGATHMGLGRLARCQGLLADDGEAEEHYRKSIRLLGQSTSATDLARSHLMFGEWLRRQRRRSDARSELRTAYGMFADMGADGFAERARIELAATGAKLRKRVRGTTTDLTPQETQVAKLVVDGHTNREVAARLFLSPATIDYHLRKVFQKLSVSSRAELTRRMANASSA
jgi:DNA-binding CsgD family transcriptional regulator